ncbi:uncharacterized protein B0P05DRAFT_551327 [Gilbertella persicaria]|uniref:uncharacterized protein n=1 Tax=Gilbertella persicaria TaxID=101096 RepID=UPI00221FB97D|nr:uncharacterized protein B0P05DRAFT_551327 [Gilbertella persicaria]KAI8069044.1 hypothetical protein B0P05DRAFT_551327 [Gilbertella persicaria]
MNSFRTPVKNTATTETRRRWRDKIQQECTDRIKLARQDKISRLREEQWMSKIVIAEKERIKQGHEESMLKEGIVDIDSLIEESLQQEAQLFEEEQEELESALAFYEASKDAVICLNCKKAALILNQNLASCPQCGFYATEKCLHDMIQAETHHANHCQGPIEYSLEPGTDNIITALCTICDLWSVFYM